jgi:hypothetical protein
MHDSAASIWTKLNGLRQPFLRRCENYAELTIPSLCLREGFDQLSMDQAHDYQSIGAQAVNHLTNKMMMALFNPTRPFFRGDLSDEAKKSIAAEGLDESVVVGSLGKIERDAIRVLDQKAVRPKLYTAVRNLIALGNVLLDLSDDPRVIGIRHFCVKRTADGRLHTGIIEEMMCFDELPEEVQEVLPMVYNRDAKVKLYKLIQIGAGGDYVLSQWVDHHRLPAAFDGKWPEDKLPYRFLTWNLSDEADYGTGLVEEYVGDFEAVSTLAEAIVNGAVLGTEFRWMVSPTGLTDVEDVRKSQNGDALPGKPEDLEPVQGGNPQAISIADTVMGRYEKRIAFGFLMNSLVTRDAERVTAEEVRMVAQELESAFGGTYSSLGVTLQLPMAHWLLDQIDVKIGSTLVTITVVTGLDALSRGGDLENLRLAFGDLTQVFTAVPPELQGRIKFKELVDYIGNGRNIDLSPFIKSDEEFAQWQADQQASRVQESNATEAGAATAQAVAQGTPQQ